MIKHRIEAKEFFAISICLPPHSNEIFDGKKLLPRRAALRFGYWKSYILEESNNRTRLKTLARELIEKKRESSFCRIFYDISIVNVRSFFPRFSMSVHRKHCNEYWRETFSISSDSRQKKICFPFRLFQKFQIGEFICSLIDPSNIDDENLSFLFSIKNEKNIFCLFCWWICEEMNYVNSRISYAATQKQ